MKKVLITGFDPFGGEAINPAFEAVKKLPDTILGTKIIKLEVPTVFRECIDVLIKQIEIEKPQMVICIGQAGGRFDITPERVAINCDDARIADNKGNQPLNKQIYPDGENAYFSTLPVKVMVEAIKSAGIPSSLSNTAGTFVCNHIMYGLLYNLNTNPQFKGIKGGFVHVPFMTEQVVGKVNTASLSLDTIAKALYVAVESAISNEESDHIIAGKTH